MRYKILNKLTPSKELYKLYWNNKYNIIPEQDIFLVSFPRSGNTWLRHILFYCNPAFSDTSINKLDSLIPDMTGSDIKAWSTLKSPKIIKSHTIFYYPFHKVIYLIRDGRDATVSNFKFVQKRYGYKKTFKEYLINKTDQWPSTWAEHVQSWSLKKQNILWIRYEDLKVNPHREAKRIVDFVGWQYDKTRIDNAIACSTIKQMKENEIQKSVNLNEVGSGLSGNWKEQYTDEELDIFNAYSKEALQKFRYI